MSATRRIGGEEGEGERERDSDSDSEKERERKSTRGEKEIRRKKDREN